MHACHKRWLLQLRLHWAAMLACCLLAAAGTHNPEACLQPSCPTLPPVQMGLDLIEGSIRDNVAAGVVEPALSKTKIIQFATEAVRSGGAFCGAWRCLLGWERLHQGSSLLRVPLPPQAMPAFCCHCSGP